MDIKTLFKDLKVKPSDNDPLNTQEALSNLGVFFLKCKQVAIARSIFEYTIKRFPEYPLPYYNLYSLYLSTAKEMLKKAIETPKSPIIQEKIVESWRKQFEKIKDV